MNEVFELQNKLKLKIILLTTKIVIKNICAFYYYCKSFRQKKNTGHIYVVTTLILK